MSSGPGGLRNSSVRALKAASADDKIDFTKRVSLTLTWSDLTRARIAQAGCQKAKRPLGVPGAQVVRSG